VAPSPRMPDVDDEQARQALRARIAAGGSRWQMCSWSLMLGDVAAARRYLEMEAAEARRSWQESLPKPGVLRWFARDQALPNQNRVREHLAVALVLGDEGAIRETTSYLRAWLQSFEEMLRKQGATVGVGPHRYGHAHGYLDFICELLPGGRRPDREQALNAGGGPSSMRICLVALVERDPQTLTRGMNGMLAEHAKTLERKTSPPLPILLPGIHVAVTAGRLGIPVEVDERWSRHRVPVEVRGPTGERLRGRLPADLLARALWAH
jgi:hypothetical protein